METTDITILGGGWAGLLCAYFINKMSPKLNILILEKDEKSKGGLLNSEEINGYIFDTAGPHILFSKNTETLTSIVDILGDNVQVIERKSFVLFEGTKVPYPFENGIFVLPAELRFQIGLELVNSLIRLNSDKNWRPTNFNDWIYGFFGNFIGEKYLEPYNRKIWKTDPKEMDADWVFQPGRVPLPILDDILRSVAGLKSIGYKEQQHFFYPKEGGILSLYLSLREKVISQGVQIRNGVEVKSLQKIKLGWSVNSKFNSSVIISTLPQIQLPNILKFSRDEANLFSQLRYNRVIVIGFIINSNAPDEQVLYVPDKNIIFHRITWMSNLTGKHEPGRSNLIAEITVPMDEKIDCNEIYSETVCGLTKIGIIKSTDDIIFSKCWVNEFGYPIYSLNHNAYRNTINETLKQIGIYSVGRWGSWHYWNTDKVYDAAKKLAAEVIPELEKH